MNPDEIKNPNEPAANVVRLQIDNIYDDISASPALQNNTHTAIQDEKWNQYHTAWQEYYQKYYEGYYNHHLKQAKISLSDTQTQPESNDIYDLRQNLLENIKKSASKVRKSRNFWPIAAGIIVMLIFLFLQYNRVIVSNVLAYVSPGNIDPQNIVVDPNAQVVVSAEPRLIIPKINVDVPVVYDIGNDYTSQMSAMTRGLAHFAIPGASSHPGQIGNIVLAGHSSNDLFDTGDYKFIFAQLDKLQIGDTVYANYQSKRYSYTVTKKELVKPTEVSRLVYPTTKPVLTLVTCMPLGTGINRLLVTADQVSPDPNASIDAPANSSKQPDSSIPGTTPTLLQRLFGAK